MPANLSVDEIRSLANFLIVDQDSVAFLTYADGTLLCASDRARQFFDMKSKVYGRRLDGLLPPLALKAWETALHTTSRQAVELPWKEPMVSSSRASSHLALNFTGLSLADHRLVLVKAELKRSTSKQLEDLAAVQAALEKMFDPITIIRGYCELLMPQQTQGNQGLKHIERNAEKLTNQITDIRRMLTKLAPL